MTSHRFVELLIQAARENTSALRSVTKLQPAGGPGAKVMPPTYEGGAYALEKRLINGAQVDTVLLDSVQSQANRFEERLIEGARSGQIRIPYFEVRVPGHEALTSLTVPHRVHDAILRDSKWDGVLFRESEHGKRLVSARAWNATPFFEYAPTALLFGTWDSQGGGGVNTAKVPRALVSEIIGIEAVRGVRTSSRIDPLGIKLVTGVIAKTDSPEMWRFIDDGTETKKPKRGDKDAKSVRPSEINHGNVTPTITGPDNGPGGVTFREAIQTTVLSFTQLRKLRFPDANGQSSIDRDVAGRAVVAALGVYAVVSYWHDGFQLRSSCQLIPAEAPQLELLGRTAVETEVVQLDLASATAALEATIKNAAQQGLEWYPGPIDLEPREDLVKLVEFSDKAVATPSGE